MRKSLVVVVAGFPDLRRLAQTASAAAAARFISRLPRSLHFRRSMLSASALMCAFCPTTCSKAAAPDSVAATLRREYIATQFALDGLKPAGDNGTYMQKVPMVGVTRAAGNDIFAGPGQRLSAGTEAAVRIRCLR